MQEICDHVRFTVRFNEVYGDESSARRWCCYFNEGRENVLDKEQTGYPSVITHDLLRQVDEFIKQISV